VVSIKVRISYPQVKHRTLDFFLRFAHTYICTPNRILSKNSTGTIMTKKTKNRIIKIAVVLFISNYIINGYHISYLTAKATYKQAQDTLYNTPQAPSANEIAKIDTMSIPEIIDTYGGSQSVNIKKVAMCESSLRPHVVNYNDGGQGLHSYGLMQIQPPTWSDFEKWSGMDLDLHSPLDQVKMAKWAFDNGYGKRWTCYRKHVA